MTTKTDDDNDPVVKVIGKIGKWQWLVILPIALREVFAGWQMLLPPFLAKENKFYCSNATDLGLFENSSLSEWERLSSPILENTLHDACNIYDLDYDSLSISELEAAKTASNKTRPCEEWIYDSESATLISQVIKLFY